MKITLISVTDDITAFGLRSISSYLKKAGHSVRMIFLPQPFYKGQLSAKYPDNIIDEAVNLSKDSDLIGISLMTNHFERAVQITQNLKKICT